MEPVLGDHLQPSLLHPSVLPGVVPHTALVDVVSHCIVTSPPKVEEEMFVKNGRRQADVWHVCGRYGCAEYLKSAPSEAAMALSSLCILLSFFPTQITTPVRGPASFSGTA